MAKKYCHQRSNGCDLYHTTSELASPYFATCMPDDSHSQCRPPLPSITITANHASFRSQTLSINFCSRPPPSPKRPPCRQRRPNPRSHRNARHPKQTHPSLVPRSGNANAPMIVTCRATRRIQRRRRNLRRLHTSDYWKFPRTYSTRCIAFRLRAILLNLYGSDLLASASPQCTASLAHMQGYAWYPHERSQPLCMALILRVHPV